MPNLFPSVEVISANTLSPTSQLEVRNRIGVVGEFAKGPAQYTEISRYDDFKNVYGSDLSPGALFVLAANDAGANNYGIIRVLAHIKSSSAVFGLTGSQAIANANVTLRLKKLGASVLSGKTLGLPVIKSTRTVISGTYVAGEIVTFRINDIIYQYVVTSRTTSSQIATGIYNILKNKSPNYKVNLAQTTVANDTITVTAQAPGFPVNVLTSVISAAGLATTTVVTPNTTDTTVSMNAASVYTGTIEGKYTLIIGSLVGSNYSANLLFTENATGAVYNRTPSGGISISNTNASAAVTVLDGTTSLQFAFNTSTRLDLASTTLILQPGAQVSVSVSPEKSVTIPVSQGEPVSTILNRLIETVQSLPKSQTGIDSIIKLDTKTARIVSTEAGADSNNVRYVLSVDNAGAVAFQSAAGAFTGGREGAKTAAITLYASDVDNTPLVGIAALSEGSYGNNLQFSIQPLIAGRFRITCTDLLNLSTTNQEEFTVDLNNFDPDGLLTDVQNSVLFTAYLLPQIEKFDNDTDYDPIVLSYQPVRLGLADNTIAPGANGFGVSSSAYMLPSYGNPFTLLGGSDGEEITTQDYLDAIALLEKESCRIICAAGQNSSTDSSIYNALINVADKSGPQIGVKYAVLCAPKGLKSNQAKALTSGLGLETRRGTMVAGWATYQGVSGLGAFNMPPDGIYAGRLATYPRHISPAASIGSDLRNIAATDLQSDNNSLNEYTRQKIDGIFYDQALKHFSVLNGRTLSSLTDWYSVSVQRLFDEIDEDAYINLQWAKSLPNDARLRSKVADSLDAYLLSRLRAGEIGAYSPTVCNSSNNSPEDISSRRLNAVIRVTPLFPADNIFVYVIREMQNNTTINLQ